MEAVQGELGAVDCGAEGVSAMHEAWAVSDGGGRPCAAVCVSAVAERAPAGVR